MAMTRERNGSFEIKVSLGYDMQGKQIKKYMTWKPSPGMTTKQTEKELARQVFLFEDRCRSGLITDGNIRFADFAEQWMDTHENNLAPSTFVRYRVLLGRINAAFGHVKLGKLQSRHLQEFYKNLAENGINKRSGKKLSDTTIVHHHRLIRVILGEAYKQGCVLRNVATLVTLPKMKQKDIVFLDEHNALKLCSILSSAPIKWKTALLLLLYTGMRRGELVGLEWSDIDFDENVIRIRRTAQYLVLPKYEYTSGKGERHKGRIIEKEPKTKSGSRCLTVDDTVIGLLREYRKWWLEQKLSNGDRWVKTEKLFIREDGGVMFPDSITDFAVKLAKRHGLPAFTPHSLRHTNISLMIAAGVDLVTAAGRAGHAQVSTTANIYAHLIQSANARAAEKIGDILNYRRIEKQA